jgi:hypothetical protein
MRRLLAVFSLFLAFASSSAFAGSGDATLRCKSPSGRTEFTATIQDIEGILHRASVTVDGASIAFGDPDRCAAIFDSAHGVYTISVEGPPTERFPNGRFLRFLAIPKSFRAAGKTADGKDTWTFDAILICTEPRKDKDSVLTPQIELRCTLTYGI